MDVDQIKRRGDSPFPTIRKSSDPLAPEMGEVDFSQEMHEFTDNQSNAVQETGKTEQLTVQEQEERKKNTDLRLKERKDKKGGPTPIAIEEEDELIEDDEPTIIDLQA